LKRLKRLHDAQRVHLPDFARLARRMLWACVVLVLLAACAVTLAVFFTGITEIRDVNFTGNRFVGIDYLEQASQIDSYKNLVTLPVDRIAESLEQNPWISEVRVQRHLLHTVNIGIVERVPVAMLICSQTGYLLDRSGFVMAGAGEDQLAELPRIHGGDLSAPAVGTRIKDTKVMECVKVLAGMPQSMRSILLLANPYDGRGPVFVSRLGFNVVYGPAEDTTRKNEVMEAIVTDVKNNKRKIAYVDLRVPDSPVIRPL
jgi:cell division protein FtsQ